MWSLKSNVFINKSVEQIKNNIRYLNSVVTIADPALGNGSNHRLLELKTSKGPE